MENNQQYIFLLENIRETSNFDDEVIDIIIKEIEMQLNSTVSNLNTLHAISELETIYSQFNNSEEIKRFKTWLEKFDIYQNGKINKVKLMDITTHNEKRIKQNREKMNSKRIILYSAVIGLILGFIDIFYPLGTFGFIVLGCITGLFIALFE